MKGSSMDNNTVQMRTDGFSPTRREVLATGTLAAFLAGLGISSKASAQQAGRPSPGDRVLTTIPEGPDSLNAAAPTLPVYTPPSATIRDFPRWVALFDLFLWEARNKNMNVKNFRATNTVMGEMAVAGDPASGLYQVSEKRTVSGLTTVFDLRLQCDPGPLPRIRSWSVEHRTDLYRGSVLAEKAEIKKGRVNWTQTPAERPEVKLPAGGALASGVVFALAGQLPEIPSFGLVNDGVHLFIPVELKRDNTPIEVQLASGQRGVWTTSTLCGFGLMPMHLFTDERGQSLLVTQGMNGYSLRSVTAWDGKEVSL